MTSALKLLVLPTLFILPWLWMKLGGREAQVREMWANNPLLGAVALLPGVVVFMVWILNQLRS